MCINCNILAPLADECADLLGVERRKYLAYDSWLRKYLNKHHPEFVQFEHATKESVFKSHTTLNDIYNYVTATHFNIVDKAEGIKLDDETILYTGKFEQISPVSSKHVYLQGNNIYPELFVNGCVIVSYE